MLTGARFLRSAAAALSRLAHALLCRALILITMSTGGLCYSPTTSPSAAVIPASPWHQARTTPKSTKVHPAAAALTVVEDNKPSAANGGGGGKDVHQLLPLVLAAPPPVFGKREEKKAARGISRPPRLVIPPQLGAAGVDPFGAAADWETDVATEVEVRGEGFCLASRRGVRHAMEDGYGVVAANNNNGQGSQMAFYGVYDGHGGRAAVDFVADKLGKNVIAAALEKSNEDEVMAAIQSAYLTTDSEFLSQVSKLVLHVMDGDWVLSLAVLLLAPCMLYQHLGVRGGACAATALVKDGELYIANVGDCRAVLGSRGGVATALTSDHTAGREDERRRIESSGGYVSCGSSGVWRVQDCLAVTRAFGDASMKPWVTANPDLSRRRITPDCSFLVLASDGLWNKVSCQEAVDVVASAGTTTPASCKELVAMARSRGSRDDITVMVVDLQQFRR
ncbi:hypothetical protein EJB05_02784, partial [Eragrostis curvula]